LCLFIIECEIIVILARALENSIGVGVVSPNRLVGINCYRLGEREYSLHASLYFKLIRISDKVEFITDSLYF